MQLLERHIHKERTMKIVVTGNPNYQGLCKGIQKIFGPDVEFIGRWNGWDVTNLDSIADYVKDYDVFINSQYGPNGEQIKLLEKVYPIFKGNHIISGVPKVSSIISPSLGGTSFLYFHSGGPSKKPKS